MALITVAASSSWTHQTSPFLLVQLHPLLPRSRRLSCCIKQLNMASSLQIKLQIEKKIIVDTLSWAYVYAAEMCQ